MPIRAADGKYYNSLFADYNPASTVPVRFVSRNIILGKHPNNSFQSAFINHYGSRQGNDSIINFLVDLTFSSQKTYFHNKQLGR